MKNENDHKQRPCWMYIDGEPATSYQELIKKLKSTSIEDKYNGLSAIIKSIMNDDNYPSNLMITVIQNVQICEDVKLKKLLFLFWEIIEKRNPDGTLKEEVYLVCNNLRKDLLHANEYYRSRALRLLSKLPHKEILESLASAMIENLIHKHPYVRRSAINCLISVTKNFGNNMLPNNITLKLKDIIDKESDLSAKRNAYLALAIIDPSESLKVTVEQINGNDVTELGDLFVLALVENLRNLCKIIPKEKSKLIKLLIELSNHKSHSVIFEIANSLIRLSSNPTIIKTAITLFCNLLVEQKDNNTQIVILKKLISLKQKNREILEEQIVTFALILNTNCTNELRRLLFNLITELIKQSNITALFDIFISDFNKLKNVADTPQVIEYKNMILNCMFQNIKKYPTLSREYPLFLLEKCLLYDSKKTFEDQITVIKEIFFIYGVVNVDDFIAKIMINFDDINSHEILQTCIWILSEYTNDLTNLKKVFDLIMKNIGDLNLEYKSEKAIENEINTQSSSSQKKVITKTVILPDGTYGTKTIVVDPSEVNKQKETKFIRNFILESNFYFSTNLVVALTKILFKIIKYDTEKEILNVYFLNTINIICAILKLSSEVIYKDPDNISRINMCMDFLLNNQIEQFFLWSKESKESYNKFCNLKKKIDDTEVTKKGISLYKNPDEFINFRHVKPFEIDNIDLADEEEDLEFEDALLKSSSNSNSKMKFTEVLTGSEDIIHIEAIVEIFTFDIIIEFFVLNKSTNIFQNISIDLFAPTNLDIIEKAPIISLNSGKSRTIRSCIKFSSTNSSFIFGQVSFANHKGHTNTINLSGIFIDLLNTVPADCTENNFRNLWLEYNWEHKVLLISKTKQFTEIIKFIVDNLNVKLVTPKSIDDIDEESAFLVANLYTKSKLGEDALINISIEKSQDNRILGSAIIRSKVKEFAQFIGDKLKNLVK